MGLYHLPGFTAMEIIIDEYKPNVHLQPFVELFWEGTFNTERQDFFKQQVVPNGYIELIIHISDLHCNLKQGKRWSQSPDYTIIGLHTKPYAVHFSDIVNVFAIRFKPEGIYNIFGVPASQFSESYYDMELVLETCFRNYCEELREATGSYQRLQLSEEFLLTQLNKNHPELTYVNWAAELIRQSRGYEKINEIPDKVYISLRQLEREFKRKIGITPKRYMRIARLNEVYKKLENTPQIEYAKVAYDCGYSDQSHFIRDFKGFMGIEPTLFMNNREQFLISHKP